MKQTLIKIFCALGLVGGFTACSDEPDSENFYTFTGEMMSDYLRNRAEYSDFANIVERADLMDLLSTYGHYTCFVPSNEAFDVYLSKRGLTSVDQLSNADCDTIARTHLVNNMYSTFEMTQDRLQTSNLLGRYLATSQGLDADDNAVVFLEGTAHIIYDLKNDSVENGIMQPIDIVIEKSNSYVADVVRDDSLIGTFYEALEATGVYDDIRLVEDPTYNSKDYPKYYYTSDFWHEVAWVPDTKKYGYTIFAEPDGVYDLAFRQHGISTDNGRLHALYDLACQIYDEVYPADVNAPGHSFDNLTDSVNPLKRFIQYHVMTRYAPSTSDLTPIIMNVGSTNEAFGIHTRLVNPVDWYQTLLPHTMLKIEQLTMNTDEDGNDCRGEDAAHVGQRFINRRYAAPLYTHRGALINSEVDASHDALNGHIYYVDDIVAFSKDVQDVVQNMRIRMDFSTIFPEVMTNGLRYEGTPTQDDASGTPDDSSVPKNGRNYYFPLGYLDGVTFTNCYVVLRRPHTNFWSWQGDEWNLFGDYDFTFRIPPVPKSGEYQLRLGFCGLKTRGVAQVYFDGVPQGIPLDMTVYLNEEFFLGDRFVDDEKLGDYNSKTDEEKAEEQKLLKNLGAYRAGRSTYHFNPSSGEQFDFTGNPRTYRRILCQTYIDANKDHYLRFRVASDGKQGNNNEFMLDYFELVPKSVYGVSGEGEMEDDL